MSEIVMWGIPLRVDQLPEKDLEYLRMVAARERPSVEWVWEELDRIWDMLALDNSKALARQDIGAFYSHPVWVVNGVFTASDVASASHRRSIASFIVELGANRIADYGGGFGELARQIAAHDSARQVDIVEPYPTRLAEHRARAHTSIRFIPEFDGEYDCIVAQDLLEHVEQPLEVTERLSKATKIGGHLVIASCYFPVIKCHLPDNFYLRYTYSWVVRGLGLQFVGKVPGAEHALVFRRVGSVDAERLRRLDAAAKIIGPWMNRLRPIAAGIKRRLRGQ